jgi:FdhE protein
MSAADATLSGLRRQRPEWEPWLVIVEEIVRAIRTRGWDPCVPASPPTQESVVPLLAGATLALEARSVRHLFERLLRLASRTGTPTMAALNAALHEDARMLQLFTASLSQDGNPIGDLATAIGADADTLHPIVALLPVPLLHACARRWAPSIARSWVEGYCPVCGSWPAFAEVRGIERSRHFRCGRCGGEWHARPLHCPYCEMSDHAELVALVPEKSGSNAVIDACKRCLGYVKTLTRLQGCPADAVMLEDLASVDLDLVALAHGYTRPAGVGYALTITATERTPTRRFFARKP